ncbi:hypothetical protein [uncultured Deinococcus sp.]|uniref:hypothetical protein n=1 Tax=uncultured Deinococcus sp. TaxID=158789 RepID=UPI0025910D66|nr:hypothetical protein [uncultured Deinococcus sp.]
MKGLQGSCLPPGTRTVLDAAQAAVVTDRTELRRLAPFMRGECTVSQAAAALGLGLTPTFKLVQRYLRLGLLSESRREARAGRALRHYRAPGAFYVPFHVRPFEQMGEANRGAGLRAFEHNLERAMHTRTWAGWGSLSCFTPAGDVYYEFVSESGEVWEPLAQDAPLILAGWNRVTLSADEARTLQRQLVALLRPYLNRPGTGEPYQVGIFLTPDRP